MLKLNLEEATILALQNELNGDNDFVYHCTKTIKDYYNILENGFDINRLNDKYVFLAEDLYDAQGYGKYPIKLLKLDVENKLNIVTLTNISSIADIDDKFDEDDNIDGIKYCWKNHTYRYMIRNINKLNMLNRYK